MKREVLVNKGVSILKATKKSNKQIRIQRDGGRKRTGRSTLRNSLIFTINRSERKLTTNAQVARTNFYPPLADVCPW